MHKFQFEWRLFRLCLTLMTLPYITYLAFAGMFVSVLSLRLKANGTGINRDTRWGLMAIALLLLLSCLFAENKGEALLQLTNWLPFFWFFAVLPLILDRLEHLEKLAFSLVIAALPLNAIALIEYLLRSPWLPRPYRRNSFLRWLRNRPHTGRAMTVFEHPNWFANFLVIIFGLSLGLIYHHLNYHTPQFKIQNPKSKIQNPKSKIQNPKSKIQNPKSKIQNPKSKIQNPKSKIQNPSSPSSPFLALHPDRHLLFRFSQRHYYCPLPDWIIGDRSSSHSTQSPHSVGGTDR
jgi:hypothetical protein